MARIELTTWISAPIERCFDLARSVEFHTHSTQASGETASGGTTSGLLDLGDEVTWRARHFGIWQTLTSRMTAYHRPFHFRDSMVSGAFARFDHDHHFENEDSSTTRMRDVFDYSAPLGWLGLLAERLLLTSYLRRFLEVRNLHLKHTAETDAWKDFLPPG